MKKEFNSDEYRKVMELFIQLRDGYEGDWFFSSSNDDFQLMVEKDPSGTYYLIINGTQFDKVSNFFVATAIYTQPKLPFEIETDLNPKVALGTAIEFEVLVEPLQAYLKTLPYDTELIIGGHSQGGGMTYILLLWIQTFFPGKFKIKVYASAPTATGNTDFKTIVNDVAEFGIYRIVNPNDVVPHIYADIPLIIQKDIPIKVPLRLKILFYLVHYTLKLFHLDYQHIGETILLKPSLIATEDMTKLEKTLKYEYSQLLQHHPSQYLNLLDEREAEEE